MRINFLQISLKQSKKIYKNKFTKNDQLYPVINNKVLKLNR